jgi:hypothetical protein
LQDALSFVRSRGVEVPGEIRWFVAEQEGLSFREAGLENADAMYYRTDLSAIAQSQFVSWESLTTGGKINVFLRAEVLESEEHTLYVFSHELFELAELKKHFEAVGGEMTYRQLAYLIEPSLGGAIHENAVRHGDGLVKQVRIERGLES